MVDNLVLSLQVDRIAHQDKRSVEGILVTTFLGHGQVLEASGDDLMLDTFLLALVVDRHVSDDSKAKLGDLGELILKFFFSIILSNQLVELFNSITAEKRFNTYVTKCDINESLQQMDQVLCILISDVFLLRVADEGEDHELRNTAFNHALAAILINSNSLESPGSGFSHFSFFIF